MHRIKERPQTQSNFRIIKQWLLLVVLSNITTSLITVGFMRYQAAQNAGKYFYVPQQTAESSIIVNPVSMAHQDIVLPTVLFALGVGLAVSLLAGILFSRRITRRIHAPETVEEILAAPPALVS
jgi:hypothetical protein